MLRLILHVVTYTANVTLTNAILARKKSLPITFGSWVAFYVFNAAGSVFLYRQGIEDPFFYYALTLTSFMPCWLNYKESTPHKLFVFFGIWGFSSFISGFSNWFAYHFLPMQYTGLSNLVLFTSFYVFFIPLFHLRIRKKIREGLVLLEKGKSIYAAFPLIAFTVFVSLFGPASKPGSLRLLLVMVLFEILILFMYYLLFSHLKSIYDKIKAEDLVRSIETQQAFQKKYYLEVEKRSEEYQRLIHDVRHHFSAIATLAKDNTPATITAYIGELLNSYKQTHLQRYCEHRIVNALVNVYVEQAVLENIPVSIELEVPQNSALDSNHLCSIFGNALENALEASRRILLDAGSELRPFISIKSKVDAGGLILRIENACSLTVRDESGEFISSKGNTGGIGLKSISKIVEDSKGCMNTKVQKGRFILSVILPRSLHACAQPGFASIDPGSKEQV